MNVFRWTLWSGLTLALALVIASPAGADDEGVYGPSAPAGSAFLRVYNGTAQQEVDAHIADKTLDNIGAYAASDFVFLPPGQYTLTAGAASQSMTLKADRYYTAALDGKSFHVVDNDRYTNKLKALVMLYNFVDGTNLSLRTADGRPVVDKVSGNAFGQREVNPVKVTLALYDGEKKLSEVKTITLERGHVFGLFATGSKDQPVTSWVTN